MCLLSGLIIKSEPEIMLEIVLKHQDLINSKNIIAKCPDNGVEADVDCFRWGRKPVESEFNFLPNYKYNDKAGCPPRRNSKKDETDSFKCGMCGLSFFHELEVAKATWDSLGEPVQINLKYTHVLQGNILKEFGLASELEKPHFLFYEYDGIDLANYFSVLEPPL